MSEAPIPLRRASAPGQEHPPHSLRSDAAYLRRRLREEIEERPLLAVGASLCVGFALGGGVTRGVVTLLFGAGVRTAGSRLGRAILERASMVLAAQEGSV